jgi:hypothetical protein
MKTLTNKTFPIFFTFTAIVIFSMSELFAQDNVMIISDPFQKLTVTGNTLVAIQKGDVQEIRFGNISDNETFNDVFSIEVKDNILKISTKKSVSDKQSLTLVYKTIDEIKVQSVATVKSEEMITQNSLSINAESAADVDLIVNIELLQLQASGAATIRLNGNIGNLDAKLSGAADLKAHQLINQNAQIEASGASKASVHVEKKLQAKTTGAADIKIVNTPEDIASESTGISSVKKGTEIITRSEENSKRKKSFDGHWAGFELGMNMFVDNNMGTSMPEDYSFLDLKHNKSLTVQLNFFEKNFSLVSNKFGMVTGLGYWVNNYRLKNNIILSGDSAHIFGFADTSKDYVKSKLTSSYLVLPLMFEYQTRNKKGKQQFHIALGGYGGVLLHSKSKSVYEDGNAKVKVKNKDQFHINPFKYGVTARVGWSNFGLFANYNLSTFFKDNKQPQVYPFEVGISLLSF